MNDSIWVGGWVNKIIMNGRINLHIVFLFH